MSDIITFHLPPDPPTPVAGRPTRLQLATVVTVESEGTIAVRPNNSRAAKAGLQTPDDYTDPQIGDVVLLAYLDGDQQRPIVLQLVRAATPALTVPGRLATAEAALTAAQAALAALAAPPTWTTVTYKTNWQRRGNSALSEVQAALIGGTVHLRGFPERITSAFLFADATREMFTLPAGMRPTSRSAEMWVGGQDSVPNRTMYLLVISTAGVARVDAVLTGATSNGAVGTYLWLDGASFPVA